MANKEPGRKAAAESRIRAYASDKRAGPQIRYSVKRTAGKEPAPGKYRQNTPGRWFQTDTAAASSCAKLFGPAVGPNAGRKWVAGAARENAPPAKGPEYRGILFGAEQKPEALPDTGRREQRQMLSNEYYARPDTLFKPAGRPKKAITRSLNRKEFLCAFLEHGKTDISGSQVENAIRPIAAGRKDRLFRDTRAGANARATVFTVSETAKANSLNPEAYLNHLLTAQPERFAADPKASADDLTPRAGEMQKSFRVSGAIH